MLIKPLPAEQATTNTASIKGGGIAVGQSLGAEAMMLQVQMLLAADFDQQMRDLGDKLKFLSNIKKSYRDNITRIQNFMTQSPNKSRKDGRDYIDLNAGQMAELFGSFKEYTYDLNDLSVTEKPGIIPDAKQKNGLENLRHGGGLSSDALQVFFTNISGLPADEAVKEAKKAGSDDSGLPFYFGHVNNKDADGNPTFAVFTEQLDKMIQQMQNNLTNVEEETEILSTAFNQLVTQRKSALDGAIQLMSKMDQIRSNSIQKM